MSFKIFSFKPWSPLLDQQSHLETFVEGIRELVAKLNLSSWCVMMVERLFLTVP